MEFPRQESWGGLQCTPPDAYTTHISIIQLCRLHAIHKHIPYCTHLYPTHCLRGDRFSIENPNQHKPILCINSSDPSYNKVHYKHLKECFRIISQLIQTIVSLWRTPKMDECTMESSLQKILLEE